MKTLNQYTVNAAATTGEWVDEPIFVGTVDFAEWCKKTDTDTPELINGETRAIEVNWIFE